MLLLWGGPKLFSKYAVLEESGNGVLIPPATNSGSTTAVFNSTVSVDFSADEFERYSRQLVLRDIGFEGQKRLRKASVCVVGVGGLGCQAAMTLAAMGVGKIRIVDRDIVELSNLHRQSFFDVSSLGLPKVEIVAQKIAALNPSVLVEPIPDSLHLGNAREIIGGVDLVVDGLDSMGARYAVNRACLKLGIPYVYGSALESYGMVSVIIPRETACLECIIPHAYDNAPTCATVGVHPAVLGVVLSIEVSEAVRMIVEGRSLLSGKILFVDLKYLAFDEFSVSRSETCPACGAFESSPPESSKRRTVEEVCGRRGVRSFIASPSKTLEIDPSRFATILRSNGFRILGVSKLSVTFRKEENVEYTLLSRGVIIVRGDLELKDVEKSSRLLWDLAKTELSFNAPLGGP